MRPDDTYPRPATIYDTASNQAAPAAPRDDAAEIARLHCEVAKLKRQLAAAAPGESAGAKAGEDGFEAWVAKNWKRFGHWQDSNDRVACEAWLAATAAASARVAALEAENARLKALVGMFPTTADGVTVTPGMTIFCPRGHEAHNQHNQAYCTQGDCWDDGCQSDSGSGTHYDYGRCYSSGDAALAASPGPKPTEEK